MLLLVLVLVLVQPESTMQRPDSRTPPGYLVISTRASVKARGLRPLA